MAELDLDSFTPEEIAVINRLDLSRMPRHLAVIMDGNGRWATQRGLPRVIGHHAGVETVRFMITACHGLGIPYLTLYSFSTENWKRPEAEVQGLMALIEAQMRNELVTMDRKGVYVRHLGRRDGLPASLLQVLDDAEAQTRHNTALTLSFAINYSGRAELLDAMKRLTREGRDPDSLTEEDISAALYLPAHPDPDLVIRTAGEMRVSNFLLWQVAYAEFWSTPALWPEFRAPHLLAALEEYQRRTRKYGGVTS
jgi:undecaprenyl diphosphate synthase